MHPSLWEHPGWGPFLVNTSESGDSQTLLNTTLTIRRQDFSETLNTGKFTIWRPERPEEAEVSMCQNGPREKRTS